MTYYLLLSGDSEKDALYETNVLGEESFETFYPSIGFMIYTFSVIFKHKENIKCLQLISGKIGMI